MELLCNLSCKHERPLCTHKALWAGPVLLQKEMNISEMMFLSSVCFGVLSPSLPRLSSHLSGSVHSMGLMEAHHHPLKCKHMVGQWWAKMEM